MPDYLNMISSLGIAGAHPGGLQLTKQFLTEINLPFPCRILDAGCGTGQTLSYLAGLGYEAAGMDADQRMVRKAKNRLSDDSVSIVHGSLELMPFESGTFDAVFCESVLSFTNLKSSLNECHRILTDGGVLAAVEVTLEQPADPVSFKEITGFYGFQALQTEDEWIKQFEISGFKNIRSMTGKDFSFDEEDPDHDVDMDDKIEPATFEVLSRHQEMLQKYVHCLGYRVFLANK
ncbi:class I SAM-dependent methyltransferase [Metabacillus sp. KIGAM252]|uniref:Class I SAM-dependent methyltransferase n=1 Tax=Metabacillus flavus TaxID=2823519 RepID=A0ABS5LEX1_9BACI|nr:class I SAM-dependent methyltransferase [Metabacillus flavus]MBS2969266.1 class I SAM-dependent methyltransferase [Metabacillus flavus]